MIISIIGAIKSFIIVPTNTFSGQTDKNPAKFEAFCNHSTPSKAGGAANSIHAKPIGQDAEHRTGGPTLPQKQQPPPTNPPKAQASKHSDPQARIGAETSNEHIEHPEHAQVNGTKGNEHTMHTGARRQPK
jgi:hypothetical protein